MQIFGKKNMAIVFTLILSIAMVSAMAIDLNTSAHTPAWQFTTHAFIAAAPNPVGVGQQVTVVMWLDYTIQGTSLANNIRFHNYQLNITKPDGSIQTINFDEIKDTTSSQSYQFTPETVGNYTLSFEFKGQKYNFGGQYDNDTYTASFKSMQLTVQETPIAKLPETPLPTEYWSRPISGANHQWSLIASNWLGGNSVTDLWQKNGAGPKSAHIMWTRTQEFGGMVGGTQVQYPADASNLTTYYSGFSYNTRFGNPMIVNGILYYQQPNGETGSGGGEYAVDLATGKTLWSSDTVIPNKAQIFDLQTPNQHGAVGAIMWVVSGTTWMAYNQYTMKNTFNLTNVPSGTDVYTNDGSIVRYIFSYNSTAKSVTLSLWNDTAAFTSYNQEYGGAAWPSNGASIPANTISSYTYANVTTTGVDLSGTANPSVVGVIPGDIMLGASSSLSLTSSPRPNSNPWTMWALNLNASKGAVGSLLWIKNYTAPEGNITRMLASQPLDPVTRAWTMTDFETGQRLAYNLDDGNLRWGPVGDQPGFQYYSSREGFPAYGNLYITGYGGIVYCLSMKDGTQLWSYGNGGVAGNTTSSGDETPWGNYPTHAAAFADGVLYTMAGEHSPNTPLYKGYKARALDAFTGQELWTLQDWSASGLGTSVAPVAIADGYLVFANAYDGQVYSVGKGPSSMTVEAPSAAVTIGQSLVIRGTVTDISPGTTQEEQAARFPHGVPAVSDASQGAWMEYIYEQQVRPINVTGVPVTLSVIDGNGNYRIIGNTTSTADGFFTYNWKPDIEGQYIVYASFSGSNSYYPSSAVTSFAVDPATPTAAPVTPAPQAPVETYLMEATAGIIAAIVIVGIAIIVLGRRRP